MTAIDLSKIPVDSIQPTTPVRLETAAQLWFPDGGMTVAGLRSEARRGRLATYRMAGKDFTTLRDVEEMQRLCRKQKESGSGSGPREADDPPSGSSETETAKKALAAARASVKLLSSNSPPTSTPPTSRSEKARVIHLRSPLPK